MEFLPKKPDEREAAIKEKLYERLQKVQISMEYEDSLADRLRLEDEEEFLSELLIMIERS